MILSEYFLFLTLRLQVTISRSLRDDKITLTEQRLPRTFVRIISIRVSQSFVTLVGLFTIWFYPWRKCYLLDFYVCHFYGNSYYLLYPIMINCLLSALTLSVMFIKLLSKFLLRCFELSGELYSTISMKLFKLFWRISIHTAFKFSSFKSFLWTFSVFSLMYTPAPPPLLRPPFVSNVYPRISTRDVGVGFCKRVSVTLNILISFSRIKSSKISFLLALPQTFWWRMIKSLAFRNNADPGQLRTSPHTSNNINIMYFRRVFNTGFTLFPWSNGEYKCLSPKLTPGNTRETLILFSLHTHLDTLK